MRSRRMLHLDEILLHVPSSRRAALRAKPTVQTDVLVFDHAACCFQRSGYIERLADVFGWRTQFLSQAWFVTVAIEEVDAISGSDVHACIAFDAQAVVKHGLDIAIQAAFRFCERQRLVKAEFNFDLDVG